MRPREFSFLGSVCCELPLQSSFDQPYQVAYEYERTTLAVLGDFYGVRVALHRFVR